MVGLPALVPSSLGKLPSSRRATLKTWEIEQNFPSGRRAELGKRRGTAAKGLPTMHLSLPASSPCNRPFHVLLFRSLLTDFEVRHFFAGLD